MSLKVAVHAFYLSVTANPVTCVTTMATHRVAMRRIILANSRHYDPWLQSNHLSPRDPLAVPVDTNPISKRLMTLLLTQRQSVLFNQRVPQGKMFTLVVDEAFLAHFIESFGMCTLKAEYPVNLHLVATVATRILRSHHMGCSQLSQLLL